MSQRVKTSRSRTIPSSSTFARCASGAHRRGRGPGAGRRHFADAQARRGDRPDRRIGRRQVDDRPGLDGLHAPRLLYRRRQHHVRRQGHPRDQRRRAARVARAEDRLYRAERRGLVQSRAHADGAGLRGRRSATACCRRRRRAPRRSTFSGSSICRAPRRSARAIPIRSPAASCSG